MKALACLFMAAGVAAASGVLWLGREVPGVLQGETVRADNLRVLQDALSSRHEAKQKLLEDLVAGKLTLLQAADRLQELDERAPESMTAVRSTYQGNSDKERVCRQAIDGVQGFLEDRPPSEVSSIIARLEGELHEHFGAGAAAE